jgi:hypothetical protein
MIVMKNECATAELQALTLELLQFLNRNVVGAGVFCWRRAIGAAYTFCWLERMQGKAEAY